MAKMHLSNVQQVLEESRLLEEIERIREEVRDAQSESPHAMYEVRENAELRLARVHRKLRRLRGEESGD